MAEQLRAERRAMSKYPDHPLATVFPLLTGDDLLAQLREQGPSIAVDHDKVAVISLQESLEHPGYIDISTYGAGGSAVLRRPCAPAAVHAVVRVACGSDLSTLKFEPRQRFRSAAAAPPDDPERVSRVYFMQARDGGPIKIGYSVDVEARRALLQIGNPDELVVIATVPGGAREERAIHRVLERTRVRGEWFTDSDRLRREIKRRSS
jgi:hypothetical protein